MSNNSMTTARFVYFDLENSGTSEQEIIQIGATGSRNDEPSFSAFLYPEGEISQYVTDNIHGIEKVIFAKKHT
jgi:DNA polymerase III epsilon subunit-like protein